MKNYCLLCKKQIEISKEDLEDDSETNYHCKRCIFNKNNFPSWDHILKIGVEKFNITSLKYHEQIIIHEYPVDSGVVWIRGLLKDGTRTSISFICNDDNLDTKISNINEIIEVFAENNKHKITYCLK